MSLASKFGDLDVYLGSDHSQLEVRVLAQMSKDKLLIELIQSGEDIHSAVGHELTGISVEKIKKNRDVRTAVKGIHFGIIYGLQAESLYYKLLNDALERGEKFNMSKEDVAKMYNTYFKRFKGVAEFIEHQHQFAQDNAYVETLFGFVREIAIAGDETRNTFWANQAVNCVDLETEALTKDGWKKWDEITRSDFILTKNSSTNHLEWQRPKKINKFPWYTGKVVEIKAKSFHAVTTEDHRWLVAVQGSPKPFGVRKTKELSKTGSHRIHRTGKYRSFKTKYIDAFVELVGWVLTDGGIPQSRDWNLSSVAIYQSARAHPDLVEDIDLLFSRLEIQPSKQFSKNGSEEITWVFWGKEASEIRKLFPDKILTPEFLADLSSRQLQILLRTMMNGDGTWGEKESFCCRWKEQTDAFQMLCTLCGIATTSHWRDMRKYKPRSKYLTNVPKMTGIWTVTLLQRRVAQVLRHQVKERKGKGVWCPTVSNGFFIARRSGTVYVTGNSPIQGTAHQLMLIAMAIIGIRPKTYDLLQRPSMEVHDSLYAFVKLLKLTEAYKQFIQLLEKEVLVYVKKWWPEVNWVVPLKAEAKAGFRLGVMVEYQGETPEEFVEMWCQKNKKFELKLKEEMKKGMSNVVDG